MFCSTDLIQRQGDLRGEPRYKITAPIVFAGPHYQGMGTAIDWSMGGVRIRCPQDIPENTPLWMHLSVPVPNPTLLTYSRAYLIIEQLTVRWVRDGQIGLEILCICPEERERLSDLIVGRQTSYNL